jgi:hypothetical protein
VDVWPVSQAVLRGFADGDQSGSKVSATQRDLEVPMWLCSAKSSLMQPDWSGWGRAVAGSNPVSPIEAKAPQTRGFRRSGGTLPSPPRGTNGEQFLRRPPPGGAELPVAGPTDANEASTGLRAPCT